MKLPVIEGVIRRRILVNYRVDPSVIERSLPSRFRPKLQADFAIAGICLIRLEHIRPKMLPQFIGLHSENAAHRVAVLWDDDDGITREGVFIRRRDTNSALNHWLGGRLFPGEHHRAAFRIRDNHEHLALSMKSRDGAVEIEVSGHPGVSLPPGSKFRSVDEVSAFFESGSLGYSVTSDPHRLDGLVLRTREWQVHPFEVTSLHSSYFDNERLFPSGSAEFDHALLMKDIPHQWHAAPDLCV